MKRPWGVAIPALYFFLEEGARHLGVQQPVSRRMATSVSRRIMVQLLHRQALAARRIEALQQQSAQQLLGRDRRAPGLAYMASKRGESRFRRASTLRRIGRNGWSAGTRRSGER